MAIDAPLTPPRYARRIPESSPGFLQPGPEAMRRSGRRAPCPRHLD
jgi:hypothetical protein